MMNIDELRSSVLNQLKGMDPFADPASWDLIEKRIPSDYSELLIDRSGASQFSTALPHIFKVEGFINDTEAHTCWERIGNFYKNQRRFHEALLLYFGLYYHLIKAPNSTGKWVQKATPLVWIAECCSQLGYNALAKRYLMLSHIDDSIAMKGDVSPGGTGVYFRMVWHKGFPDSELRRYAKEVYPLFEKSQETCLYPEWVLQNLDENWLTEIPSPSEVGIYWANTLYMSYLISKLGDKSGKTLETLAQYMLACMPGCRTTLRKRTISSEIDIVCSVEGIETDFRSELGRYFVCECKDWKKAVDFSSIAKFCRVLDSIKSRFGVLFSPKGLSGEKVSRHATNEPQKLFQNHGIVLVVIDEQDMLYVAGGGNFISLLRNKYEKVRLDLAV
jgi:hypothetical protein